MNDNAKTDSRLLAELALSVLLVGAERLLQERPARRRFTNDETAEAMATAWRNVTL